MIHQKAWTSKMQRTGERDLLPGSAENMKHMAEEDTPKEAMMIILQIPARIGSCNLYKKIRIMGLTYCVARV